MTKIFFVVHNKKSYEKRPDLLGFYVKTDLDGEPIRDRKGKRIPENALVNEVKPGDTIVYYTRGDCLIRGMFEIEEKLEEDDEHRNKNWGPDIQFRLKTILKPKGLVDFRNIIFSGKDSLEMFEHLENLKKQWGMSIGGKNYIKRITPHDLKAIEKELLGKKKEEESIEEVPKFPRKHLEIQFKVVKIMKSYGYQVHVARNDKSKILEKGEEILENIPEFHNERVIDITSRIDCVAFSEYNVPKILTEVVDTAGTLTDSLYRLNEVALAYPRSKGQKFYIMGPETLRHSFEERIQSLTFKVLNDTDCTFLSYREVDSIFKETLKKKLKL